MARVHVVQVGTLLIATLGDELDDRSALDFQDELGERVVRTNATGVLMDVSALEIVDSFICRVLTETARIVRVLGADVVLSGIRPAVAITMVELGLSLDEIDTARTTDGGLALLTNLRRPVDAREGDDPR